MVRKIINQVGMQKRVTTFGAGMCNVEAIYNANALNAHKPTFGYEQLAQLFRAQESGNLESLGVRDDGFVLDSAKLLKFFDFNTCELYRGDFLSVSQQAALLGVRYGVVQLRIKTDHFVVCDFEQSSSDCLALVTDKSNCPNFLAGGTPISFRLYGNSQTKYPEPTVSHERR